MDLTSARLLSHPRGLLMLRRKRDGAGRIPAQFARSLILRRRRRNLQLGRSQGDTRNPPKFRSARSSASQRRIRNRPSHDLARPLHTSSTYSPGKHTDTAENEPLRLERISEANSSAWRSYPPRDIASHRHRRCCTSRVIAVLCGSSENYSRDIDRRLEWARAPRIFTTVQLIAAPSAAGSSG